MSELGEFLAGAKDQPYRMLVEYHIRRQSTEQLQSGGAGEVTLLPSQVQDHIIEFIDAVNDRIGYDKRFWDHADVKTAFGFIVQEAANALPIQESISCEADAYKPENHELAFSIFQIATLNFAYSASMNRKQRKFMGIRKGILR